jgi:ubiquinone/menaquinone biosynthesis C-methylase UbiE
VDAWSRVAAVLYDPFLWLGERAGMRARRVALLRHARGRVLEIGAGTGLNLELYPAVDELVLTEPDPAMARRLERRLRRSSVPARVVAAGAEELPAEAGSVDTVVSTLVLCTVPDPRAALAEVARVLRPGGQLLVIEHVRADNPGIARWQDRLQEPWRRFGNGCHCNRPTLDLTRAAGFDTSETHHESWRWMPAIVRPLIVGRATPQRRAAGAAATAPARPAPR